MNLNALTAQTTARTAASQAAQAMRGTGGVEAAVRLASQRTGVDFSYLMEKAAVESGFRTDVKAATSSATGLYQFIDSTWLATVKEHGAKHGLGQYANAIDTRPDGRYFVSDPDTRREILDLRKDPTASALMAAEFTRDNKEYLEKNVSGNIGSTELYLAHFLGAQGGAKFLNAMKESPNRKASELFPDAAGANRAVFYDKTTGDPKTLKQIYDRFDAKFRDGDPWQAPDSALVDRLRTGDMPDGFTVQTPSSPQKQPGSPLSIYQVLALNALETPDESGISGSPGDRDSRRVRDQPVRTERVGNIALGLGLGMPQDYFSGA